MKKTTITYSYLILNPPLFFHYIFFLVDVTAGDQTRRMKVFGTLSPHSNAKSKLSKPVTFIRRETWVWGVTDGFWM